MSIKDFVGPMLLAVGLTILVRSFFGGADAVTDTNSFIAPVSAVEQEPLHLDIACDSTEKAQEEKLVQIETAHGTFLFSSHGAILKEIIFKRIISGVGQQFITISPETTMMLDTHAFLVALDDKTPFYYELISQTETDEYHLLTYQVQGHAATIEKKFYIYKEMYKIDVELSVKPRSGVTVSPRIIWPSPLSIDPLDKDIPFAILFNKTGKFIKTVDSKLNERQGFVTPSIFGTENKYFVHSMVKDENNFAARAYYKVLNKRIISFIESRAIADQTTWKLSFYMGPKAADAIAAVNQKLEVTLDYGFLSPLTKAIIYLLKVCNDYVHNYGLAIILITILMKLILLPISLRGERSTQKAADYAKKLQYIGQRFKNDPEGLAAAREELLRTHGMPGMGFCLPLLVQLPLFWSLNGAINNSMELYRAPFVWWIQDLSLPDPYYVIPGVLAIIIFFAMTGGQKKKGVKQLFMALGLALIAGSWMATVSTGLTLFLVVNALLHFAQKRLAKMIPA